MTNRKLQPTGSPAPAKIRVKLNLAANPKAKQPREAPSGPPPPSRTVQLLALAHHFQHLLDTGQAKDLADIARLGGISRARATQIANLAFLAPSIQEQVIFGEAEVGEHALRPLLGWVDWEVQKDLLAKKRGS